MHQDEGNLIALRHECLCNKVILLMNLSPVCPNCGDTLTSANIENADQVPSPFVDAKLVTCCILVKPTHGTFIKDYIDGCDLHIAAIDTQGFIHEFNSAGAMKRNVHEIDDWNACIAIKLGESEDEKWKERWDRGLQSTMSRDHWTKDNYDETNFNCFDFIVSFLRSIDLRVVSKTHFTQEYLLERIQSLKLYVSWYRRVAENGFHVIDIEED